MANLRQFRSGLVSVGWPHALRLLSLALAGLLVLVGGYLWLPTGNGSPASRSRAQPSTTPLLNSPTASPSRVGNPAPGDASQGTGQGAGQGTVAVGKNRSSPTTDGLVGRALVADYQEALDKSNFDFQLVMGPLTVSGSGFRQTVTLNGDVDGPDKQENLWNRAGLHLAAESWNAFGGIECQWAPPLLVVPGTFKVGQTWETDGDQACRSGQGYPNAARRHEADLIQAVGLWRSGNLSSTTITIRRTIDTQHNPSYSPPPGNHPSRSLSYSTHTVETDVIGLTGGFLIRSDQTSSTSGSGSGMSSQSATTVRHIILTHLAWAS